MDRQELRFASPQTTEGRPETESVDRSLVWLRHFHIDKHYLQRDSQILYMYRSLKWLRRRNQSRCATNSRSWRRTVRRLMVEGRMPPAASRLLADTAAVPVPTPPAKRPPTPGGRTNPAPTRPTAELALAAAAGGGGGAGAGGLPAVSGAATVPCTVGSAVSMAPAASRPGASKTAAGESTIGANEETAAAGAEGAAGRGRFAARKSPTALRKMSPDPPTDEAISLKSSAKPLGRCRFLPAASPTAAGPSPANTVAVMEVLAAVAVEEPAGAVLEEGVVVEATGAGDAAGASDIFSGAAEAIAGFCNRTRN